MGQQSKVPTRIGSRHQWRSRGSRGVQALSAGSGAEPQSQTVSGKYLIEWSSVSGVWGGAQVANGFWKIFDRMELVFINSIPCQKTAQDLEQVGDVVIRFQFQQFIFYSYIFSFI